MKIKFYGGAKMVTGSNHLIEANGKQLLLDCGMYQGGREEEILNEEPFPYDPAEIDYVVLSHAHIDHSGRIPKLVKEGFEGRILTTKATLDLSRIMLQDSGHIQEYDIEWENRKRQRSGRPLLEPLYTVEDANKSLTYFEHYYYNQIVEIDETFRLRFLDAGHILGSSIVELWVTEEGRTEKIVYSGDLGVKEKAIIKEPDIVKSADYLILEATYGDRTHEPYTKTKEDLIEIIDRTTMRGGSVIIPSFAVGRTQELIYQLNAHYDSGEVEEYKKIPVYIDSPMAVEATETYEKNADLFNEETKERILSGDNPFSFSNLRYVSTVEESMSLNKSNYPKVIISASGMADAGRVRHHLKHNIWDPRNTVLFVGYQAHGSTGRKILEGEPEINILGERIQVKAEIEELQGISAHADLPMLLEWVGKIEHKPKNIFLVHGEEESLENLKREIEEKYNITTSIAELGEVVEIKGEEEEFYREKDLSIDLKSDLEESIEEVKSLFDAYEKNSNQEITDEFAHKYYSDYSVALYDIKNRLMELLMITNK